MKQPKSDKDQYDLWAQEIKDTITDKQLSVMFKEKSKTKQIKAIMKLKVSNEARILHALAIGYTEGKSDGDLIGGMLSLFSKLGNGEDNRKS